MATWNDIFVQQATAAPDWTTSTTVTLPTPATAGNRLILCVVASADATVTTATLTSTGWSLDQTVSGWQVGYIFSRPVPTGGIAGVTVPFSASCKPVVRLIELSGISTKHAGITNSGASTGTLATTVSSAVVFGLVHAVVTNGSPSYVTWSNSFSSVGSLLSTTSAPYDVGNSVVMGIAQHVTTTAGAYTSAATLGGGGSPSVGGAAGMAIAYQIGASLPTVDAGQDITLPLGVAVSRTASEDNGGGTITSRSWTIHAGPSGSGTTISNGSSLTWTPSVAGVYTLRYSATNSAGAGYDDVIVTIIAPELTTGATSPITVTLAPATYRSRIRAENSSGTSTWSAWSAPFTVSDGSLALPRIPWEGGPSFWAQFDKASAAGWTDPTYFPISVFLGKADPAHVSSLKDAGINLYMAVEHSPAIHPLTNVTDQGLFVMPGIDEWTPAEVGNNPRAVAWFISDELDMGMGLNTDHDNDGDVDEYDGIAEQRQRVALAQSYNDGRFLHANFGNGILRTFWSPNTMYDHVALMNSSSADKYTYTSPHVIDLIDGMHDAPDWPNGVPVNRAYSYGWQADQMRRFQNQNDLRAIWTFIETARPLLIENGAMTIQPDQIEGAVWSALIHEARGIAYFQHNNDAAYGGNYSIVDIPAVHTKVKAINAKVKSLAPVLNTQSYYNSTSVVDGFTYYRYSFSNGTDTMLKTYDGHAYIFAGIGIGHSTGTKTFALPPGVNGTTVEVVGESRTLTVTNGSFVDSFAFEYTHHVYKIALV